MSGQRGLKFFKGFTLAEVLITLVIIGIVAALTIPSLVQQYKERAIITALRKFYFSFSQALNLTILSNRYEFTSKDIEKYLTIEKVCEQTNVGCATQDRRCLSGNGTLAFGGGDPNHLSQYYDYVVLSGGAVLRITRNIDLMRCPDSPCNEIAVDMNGDAGPNICGQDTFYFYLTKKGVVPFGYDGDTRTPFSKCVDRTGLGYECTAWVIENDNMDYLRCDDLSWDGKHKCSD